MEYFVIVVVLLFVLAISDLVVGVSNDAVNFLNSAIGSKAAPYKVIIITAIVGILLGSVFSSGIMEIARKGIFYPQYFTFDIILIVFLAVMLTDIILLDVFNSLGLPTSTTVSIVFELLGASLVSGILFSMAKDEKLSEVGKYINFESTSNIVSGIFLSILIAFTAGVVIQYLCRLLFTFQYQNKLARYGALYSGVGITSIVYFLLIKGLKGTTIISKESRAFINDNTVLILGIIFLVATAILFLLQKSFKVNPLKVVVLAGTFSLAMAFAGNDLVNFIGVPITGFLAFKNWQASGVPAHEFYQNYLASSDVVVPNYMLIIAGIIMGLTIWLSAKAKKVTETEVNLGRQDEGDERFKPNAISRNIVNSSLVLSRILGVIIPTSVVKRYNNSFEKSKLQEATVVQEPPAFDLVRAATNLVVASILIAWATSLKLPLSTTYVSFMVAMGSSLADKAWGRESAVYRVAGVLSVIGGWFITALIAFTVSALFAFILYQGGEVGTYILVGLVFTFIIVSQVSFNKKEKKNKTATDRLSVLDQKDLNLIEKYRSLVGSVISEIAQSYNDVMNGLREGDVPKLQKAHQAVLELEEHGYKVRTKSIKYIKNLTSGDPNTSEVLLLSSDFIQDLAQSTKSLSNEALFYIKNLHQITDPHFITDLEVLDQKMNQFFNHILVSLEQPESESLEDIRQLRNDVRAFINQRLEEQIQAINKNKPSTKQGILQTNVYLQSRDIQAVLMRISKMFLQLYDAKITSTQPS
ncbi:inorganic phosphate transporter [Riemerella columbina]|uniref:inorganic phosphate transporter n=1 Tax=Riemerella columbina TaxID=103810 RepID=UPI00266E9277|nr:inorganic phosphate transporter [Riemerella columbina]WKS95404.1 inorganic phosphate transporter [Riemerella columbina]